MTANPTPAERAELRPDYAWLKAKAAALAGSAAEMTIKGNNSEALTAYLHALVAAAPRLLADLERALAQAAQAFKIGVDWQDRASRAEAEALAAEERAEKLAPFTEAELAAIEADARKWGSLPCRLVIPLLAGCRARLAVERDHLRQTRAAEAEAARLREVFEKAEGYLSSPAGEGEPAPERRAHIDDLVRTGLTATPANEPAHVAWRTPAPEGERTPEQEAALTELAQGAQDMGLYDATSPARRDAGWIEWRRGMLWRPARRTNEPASPIRAPASKETASAVGNDAGGEAGSPAQPEDIELLDCPHCGGAACLWFNDSSDNSNHWHYGVECQACAEAESAYAAEAAANWNRRIPDPRLAAITKAAEATVVAGEPFLRAYRAIGDFPVRFYTETGYREMTKEDFDALLEARAALTAALSGGTP